MLQTALLSGSPILDVDASLLVYLAVFGVLFFLLRALVFRPMMELFDERERATVGAREEARALERESEAKVASFEAQLGKVRTEATSERDRLRAEGSRLDRSLNEKVRKETDEMVADAEAKMDREAAKIREEIAAAAPALAREIAHKLLGREVGK
ncbi:MAG: ATP synthase F0 subunit B [Sandaracinaceae bacterium]|nr:ATP synthase F0 subunit B [Sandaracinaceae bacterium]